jgi:hypothetical protein
MDKLMYFFGGPINLVVVAFIIYLIGYSIFKKKKPKFVLTEISSNIKDSELQTFFYFHHHLKCTNMQPLIFTDVNAMGKFLLATFTIPANAAGNIPQPKEGTLKAVSTNEAVATAELGAVDAVNGKYELKIKYSGKTGSADCKLIASFDLDNSGDPDVEATITTVITTEEASGFGEPVVTELQEEAAAAPTASGEQPAAEQGSTPGE